MDKGIFGSNCQENNFANEWSHNKKDDSKMNFQKSMKYTLLEHEYYKNILIDENVSDSPRCRCPFYLK